MKFSLPSLLVLGLTLVSCAFASPINTDVSVEPLLAGTHQLAARHYKYPIKCNDELALQIMTSVKADLYAKVFGSITETFCKKTAASIQVKAVLLGGMVEISESHRKTIQYAAVKNLRTSFDSDLRVHLQASIYEKLEITLKKSLHGKTVRNSSELLCILKDFQVKAKALIKIQLPKIGASLTLKAKSHVDAAIKHVDVNIPLLAHVSITSKVCAKSTMSATIKVAIKACAKLDAKASAMVILKHL